MFFPGSMCLYRLNLLDQQEYSLMNYMYSREEMIVDGKGNSTQLGSISRRYRVNANELAVTQPFGPRRLPDCLVYPQRPMISHNTGMRCGQTYDFRSHDI